MEFSFLLFLVIWKAVAKVARDNKEHLEKEVHTRDF